MPESKAAGARAGILLVDDQPTRLWAYEAILSRLDVDCVRALSGTEALEKLLARDFAAILLGVSMPGTDGLEMARLIREHPHLEPTPIIVVAAGGPAELVSRKAYEAGAIDCVSVPIVPEILRTKVSVLVDLHRRRGALQASNRALAEAISRLESEHARALRESRERRRLAEERLEEADRRKDEYLAMLAHELRNPVAPIRNASDVLLRLPSQDAKQRSLVEIIQRQTVHLARLLDDLLDAARITQGRIELRREVVAVASCIELAVEMVNPLIRERRHRLTVMQLQPLYIDADRMRFAQCAANVLTNAAKFTPPGGDIQVRAYADDDEAVVEIADTGIGISPDFLPRMFDLFTQGDRTLERSQGGLGIGLSICRRLVGMHGGSISGASAGPGRGATFTIRLPRVKPLAGAARSAPADAELRRRVLIVDDNHDAADALAVLLQLEGHEPRTVYSAEDALDEAAAFNPEIVLLDIGLPRIDGYEVARRIKAIVSSARLIALTGYGQLEDRQRSAAAGFDAHLVKPVEPAALEKMFASKK